MTVFADRIITSIDIGTTKISVLIARVIDNTHIDIIGVGKAPSLGLKKGVVVDIAKTIQAIKAAVGEAELMAGLSVETAYIGISGGHIKSLNSDGVVPISKGSIRAFDVMAVLAAAKAISIAEDQQIIHVLPQYFIIDSRDQVFDPIGMHGIRLEVQAHIITGAVASVQNLIKCCQAAGVEVADIILEQLASAAAVLSHDEKELGVAVLDIGGGTSDLAIYQNGSIRHTKVIPIAGNHFTHDIAVGLRTTIAEAERIKKQYATVVQLPDWSDELIEIDLIQGNQKQIVQKSDLTRILQPRAEEIFMIVQEELAKRKLYHFITTGLVLTGGGSLLHGMQELAESLFKIPVRIGYPSKEFALPESLQSPMYATGYGLLLYVMQRAHKSTIDSLEGPLVKRVFERMKLWVSDFF